MSTKPSSRKRTARNPECDCCNAVTRSLNEYGLCFECAVIKQITAELRYHTDLGADDRLDIAIDVIEKVKAEIRYRLIDQGQAPEQFIADVKRGAAKRCNSAAATKERRPHKGRR